MTDNMVKVSITLKPVIPDTLRKLKPGEKCRFRARELGTLQSVQNAIYRLNNNGGNYTILEVINNGESYIVGRN